MRRTIQKKLVLIFSVLFGTVLFISFLSIYNLNYLSLAIENIMKANYRSVENAQNMLIAIERQDSAELEFLFTENDAVIENYYKYQTVFIKELGKAESNITETGEEEIINAIYTSYNAYTVAFDELRNTFAKEGASKAKEFYFQQAFPTFEKVKASCRDLLALNQNAMVTLKNHASDYSRNSGIFMIIITVIACAVGVFSSFFLIKRIISPLRLLIAKIKKIAEGDYKQELSEKGSDEIAELSTEFNTMAKKLSGYEESNIKKIMLEKKKAEKIVDTINEAIIVTDKDNRIIVLNNTAEKFFDVRLSEVMNRHFLEVIKNEEIFQCVQEAIKFQDFRDKVQKNISISKEEEKSYYRVYSKVMKDYESDIFGVVTLINDITKMKEIEKMKTEFISTVSHEFRTPLTSMRMSAELILDETAGKINEKQRELLTIIKEEESKLNTLVNDLLELSRVESGKIIMDIRSCSLNDLLEFSTKPFIFQFKENHIRFDFNKPKKDIKVKADFSKIGLVITNILGNALRYAPKDGEGVVSLSVKEVNSSVVISISDNGRGIPFELQDKIFEKFTQLPEQSSEEKGSSGLGLAISKEILKAHGNNIWVISTPGKGTKFQFNLNKDKH